MGYFLIQCPKINSKWIKDLNIPETTKIPEKKKKQVVCSLKSVLIIFLGGYVSSVVKRVSSGVPFMAQWLMNPTRIQEDAGLIPDLIQ